MEQELSSVLWLFVLDFSYFRLSYKIRGTTLNKNDDVWVSTLDDIYECRVSRTKPYCGKLTITVDGNLLFEQSVSLDYDARFGPDIANVAEWQELCVNYIDGE